MKEQIKKDGLHFNGLAFFYFTEKGLKVKVNSQLDKDLIRQGKTGLNGDVA